MGYHDAPFRTAKSPQAVATESPRPAEQQERPCPATAGAAGAARCRVSLTVCFAKAGVAYHTVWGAELRCLPTLLRSSRQGECGNLSQPGAQWDLKMRRPGWAPGEN